MRKLLITLLAAASLAPSIATAQEAEGRHQREASAEPGRQVGDAGPRQFNRNQAAPQFQRPQAPPQPQVPQPQVQQPRAQAPVAAQAPAFQANQGWRGNRGGDFGNRGGQPQAQPQGRPNFDGNRGQFQGNVPTPPPVVTQQQNGQPNFQRGDQNGRRGDWNGGNRPGSNGNNNVYQNNGNRGYYNNNQNYNRDNNQRWNNGWHNDNRYDWRGNRSYNRDLYRLPRYYSPYGYSYGYQRFGIGVRLNALLFSQSYWIDDPEYYRLPDAYGPYRWVRYYNDALLVDIYTGQVVDVVYDIFW